MWYSFQFDEDDVQRKAHAHVTLRRTYALFRPFWRLLLGMVLCVMLTAGLSVVPAYLLAQIVDRGILHHELHALLVLVALSVGVTLLTSGISIVQTYLTVYANQRMVASLRDKLFRHLLALSLRFFSTAKLGDLLSRFTNDIGGIQMVINGTFISLISNVLTISVTVTFMFAYNWHLAVVAVAVLPFWVLPPQRVGKRSRTLSRQTQETWSEMTTTLEETLDISGFLLIKNFGQQEQVACDFEATNAQLTRLIQRQAMLGVGFFTTIRLLSALGPTALYLIGGLAAAGALPGATITLGQIVAFVALLGQLYVPVSQLSSTWVNVQGATSLLDRLFAIFDETPDIQDRPTARALRTVQGRVTFDHVDFSYPGSSGGLHDISFTVQPGQVAAIVGPSGAGKTTLTYLLARLYDVTAGAVRLDGMDVRDIRQASLAEQIGMVTQETYLLHASIRANIAFGKPEATEEEIISAAKAAYLHEVILSLPDGYATVVGERGYKLSGGERQRIAIARVILKNPRILILDEATSALDSQSE